MIFDQYLRKPNPPVLKYTLVQKGRNLEVTANWEETVPGFNMVIGMKSDKKGTLKPTEITTAPQTFVLEKMKAEEFSFDETHAYFKTKKITFSGN